MQPEPQLIARRPRPTKLEHQPALDGIRGLAVVAVLLFHNGFSWAKGGFLGVSTFFTLSGFLITGLLLAEHERTGRIVLHVFWIRRARRLLPAALFALAGIAVFGWLLADADQVRALRADGLAALGYVANWRFVLSGKSYGDIFAAPSPAQHFWSLAIEEQFYVVFPLMVVGLLAAGRGSRRLFAAVLAGLTVASLIATVVLYTPGFDPSRVYYGTDTRAAELLVGALLALLVNRGGRSPSTERSAHVVRWAGAAALAGIVLAWSLTPETAWWLYRGGLLGLALLASLVIRAAVEPAGPVRRLLGWAPFRLVGAVSYGLYLYHWPVFLWLSATRTGLAPWPLFGLRAAVTGVLAACSFVVIERPIRSGLRLASPMRLALLPVIGVVVAGSLVLVTIAPPAPPIAFASVSSAHAAPGSPASKPAATHLVPAIRVLVVGDSIAYVLGKALERYGRRAGGIEVWDVAIAGCGVARGGDLIGPSGVTVDTKEGCNSWAERWAAEVANFAPDVVVIVSGSWDLASRRLPEWSRFRTIGDQVYDDWLDREYNAALDVLTARGARVVWLNAPCLRHNNGPAAGMFDPKRTPIMNRTILPRLAAERRDVAIADLFAKVCPDGVFTENLAGSTDARPDGVHFDDASGDWIADWLVPQLQPATIQ